MIRTRITPKEQARVKKILRIGLIGLGVFVVLLLVGPFLIPVPPLAGTVPAGQLAGPDSRFIEVNGLRVHYQEYGSGDRAFVLLHGFLASTFSWREVTAPLAEKGRVLVFDRPGFGLTERPVEWEGLNPYSPEAQANLVVGLMDALQIERAILVGNSAGGAIAAYTALLYPDRVEGLILVDAAIYTSGGSPGWLQPLLRTPQARRLGPLLVRNIREWGKDFGRLAWYDPSKMTDAVWEGYMLPLQVQNWDRALWEFTLASRPLNIPDRLSEIQIPALVLTGEEDRIVPAEESRRLASELPEAELVVIPNCGHVPHEECPAAFLGAVEGYLDRIIEPEG
jgi:pimeloyl-ACP methyl ester carboxylesterase